LNLTTTNIQADNRLDFIYFTNYIIRNVVPVKEVGYVHNGEGFLKNWLIKNCFRPIFDFSSQQLLKIDLSSLINLSPCAVIAHDPFKSTSPDNIGDILGVLDLAKHVVIVAIPTGEYHFDVPQTSLRCIDWSKALSQIGNVVEIYHCQSYSLFMVLK